MWQWPDGNIIIPERVLKKGGREPHHVADSAPSKSVEWGQLATSPSVSADLSRSAFSSHQAEQGSSIQLVSDLDPLIRSRDSQNVAAWEEQTVLVRSAVRHGAARWSCHLTAGGSPRDTNSEGFRVWDVDAILEGKE